MTVQRTRKPDQASGIERGHENPAYECIGESSDG